MCICAVGICFKLVGIVYGSWDDLGDAGYLDGKN